MAAVVLPGACGTGVHPYAGRLAAAYPLIAGHVTAGGPERIRGAQRDVAGRMLAEGDRVTRLPDDGRSERTARHAPRRSAVAALMPGHHPLQPAGACA